MRVLDGNVDGVGSCLALTVGGAGWGASWTTNTPENADLKGQS